MFSSFDLLIDFSNFKSNQVVHFNQSQAFKITFSAKLVHPLILDVDFFYLHNSKKMAVIHGFFFGVLLKAWYLFIRKCPSHRWTCKVCTSCLTCSVENHPSLLFLLISRCVIHEIAAFHSLQPSANTVSFYLQLGMLHVQLLRKQWCPQRRLFPSPSRLNVLSQLCSSCLTGLSTAPGQDTTLQCGACMITQRTHRCVSSCSFILRNFWLCSQPYHTHRHLSGLQNDEWRITLTP